VRFTASLPLRHQPQLKNVATRSWLHGALKPSPSPDKSIDITVSSIGNSGQPAGGYSFDHDAAARRGASGVRQARASLVVGGSANYLGQEMAHAFAVNVPWRPVPQRRDVEREVPGACPPSRSGS